MWWLSLPTSQKNGHFSSWYDTQNDKITSRLAPWQKDGHISLSLSLPISPFAHKICDMYKSSDTFDSMWCDCTISGIAKQFHSILSGFFLLLSYSFIYSLMSGACSNCVNDSSTIDFIQIESDGKSYVINVRLIVFSRYSVFKWLQVISWIAIGSVWMAIAHSRSSLSTNPTSSLDSSFHPPAHTFFLFPYRLDLNQCKSDILHRPFSFLCFFF